MKRLVIAWIAWIVWVGIVAETARARTDPALVAATVTTSQWYGEPQIQTETWVLIHPPSNTVRIGNLTGVIAFYAPGSSLVADMPSGRLVLHLSAGLWEYQGSDGIAFGTL